MDVHTNSSCPSPRFFRRRCNKESCGFRPVKDADTEALHLTDESWLESGSPYTEGKAVLIVISKEEFRLFIPEFRTGKGIFRIPDFSAETFHIKKTVIPFAAPDIVYDTVSVTALLIYKSPGDLFRCDTGAGVGTGIFPMIKTGAGRTGFFSGTFLQKYDTLTTACSSNGSKTACHAATENENIGFGDFYFTDFIFIGPRIFFKHIFS